MYQFFLTRSFKALLKKHVKKHRGLKRDLIDALRSFDKAHAIGVGSNVYKFRLKTKSLNKGKSGSFRVVVLLIEAHGALVPLAIYFKGDRESITLAEINARMQIAFAELRYVYPFIAQ